ncbi:XkdX family protein, partial [Dysosmobacter welbionis]
VVNLLFLHLACLQLFLQLLEGNIQKWGKIRTLSPVNQAPLYIEIGPLPQHCAAGRNL